MEIKNTGLSIAASIVKELDKKDGNEDGKINATEWNEFVKDKGGKSIWSCIYLDKAEKSVKYYLKKNSASADERNDLAQKWLDKITEQNNEIANAQKYGFTPELKAMNNSKVAAAKLPKVEDIMDDAAKKTAFFDEHPLPKVNDKEKVSYQTLPKTTRASSLKSLDIPINKNALNEAFNNRIRRYLKIHKLNRSAMTDTVEYFLEAADKYKLNPFYLIAISCQESAFGTSHYSLYKNNLGGLKVKNGTQGKVCATISDSIDDSAKILHGNVYNNNRESIDAVGMRGNYVCDNPKDKETNDPHRARRGWITNVVSLANDLQNEYNRIISETPRIPEFLEG